MLFADTYPGLNLFSSIDSSTNALALSNGFYLSKLEVGGCILHSLMQASISSSCLMAQAEFFSYSIFLFEVTELTVTDFFSQYFQHFKHNLIIHILSISFIYYSLLDWGSDGTTQ